VHGEIGVEHRPALRLELLEGARRGGPAPGAGRRHGEEALAGHRRRHDPGELARPDEHRQVQGAVGQPPLEDARDVELHLELELRLRAQERRQARPQPARSERPRRADGHAPADGTLLVRRGREGVLHARELAFEARPEASTGRAQPDAAADALEQGEAELRLEGAHPL
jgi:hypothetical protein